MLERILHTGMELKLKTTQHTRSLIKGIKVTGLIRRTAPAPALNQPPGAAAWLICRVPKAASIIKLSPMQRQSLTAGNIRC